MPVIYYQLIDIPIVLLRLIEGVNLVAVGRLTDRQSLESDVYKENRKIFRIHFDGSDGKCTISNLVISECEILLAWDLQVSD